MTALVYFTSRGSLYSKVVYEMSVADAKRFCSMSESAGVAHMFCWTDRDRMKERVGDGAKVFWRKDDGRHNKLFKKNGIKVLRRDVGWQKI